MRAARRPDCRLARGWRTGAGWGRHFAAGAAAGPDFPPGLELLKLNLLQRALRTFCEPHFDRPLRRAADRAARLAVATGYPMLVFPELFAELAIPAMVETEYRLHGGFHFAGASGPGLTGMSCWIR